MKNQKKHRDRLAGLILSELLSLTEPRIWRGSEEESDVVEAAWLAEQAYAIADAMLTARKRKA